MPFFWRKQVLPRPLVGCVGGLAHQRVGQLHAAISSLHRQTVLLAHVLQVFLEGFCRAWPRTINVGTRISAPVCALSCAGDARLTERRPGAKSAEHAVATEFLW